MTSFGRFRQNALRNKQIPNSSECFDEGHYITKAENILIIIIIICRFLPLKEVKNDRGHQFSCLCLGGETSIFAKMHKERMRLACLVSISGHLN